MVLDYPFVWPLWNAAENSQRQVCKQSPTLSESTTRDGLCSASDTPQKGITANVLTLLLPPQHSCARPAQSWMLLMEAGVSYNKQRLHKAGYFRELLATNPAIDEGLCSLLRLCRETVVRLGKTESALVRSLERDSLLIDRVERLMSIPAVGPITALTWALEIGDLQRFPSIKKAISYCGLCGAERSSGTTVQRTPLSKQRNKHLQATLIEAAKMAP